MYTWLEWDVITCNDSWYITVYIVDIVDILPLYLVGGWATPLKKNEFVSWDDDIPNWMEK